MTEKYINKELSKYYTLFAIYGVILLTSWVVIIQINPELLLVPIVVTIVLVYTMSKRMPKYLYLGKLLRYFKKGQLYDFINKEYSEIKNAKNYRNSNRTNQTPTSTRFNVQYQSQKDIYMSTKRFNKVELLLKLKRLMEQETPNNDLNPKMF